MTLPPSPSDGDFSTLFSFLPIGAYRSTPDGLMLRANQALVRLNGYDDEAQLLMGVRDIATEWYVQQGRRSEFVATLLRDGFVRGFVSEIWRHKTRDRVWISENLKERSRTSPNASGCRKRCARARSSSSSSPTRCPGWSSRCTSRARGRAPTTS